MAKDLIAESVPTFPTRPLFDEPPILDKKCGGSLLLFGEVAGQLGVDVTDTERNDWRATLGVGMVLDHLLDVESADAPSLVGTFVAIMNGNLREDLDRTIQIRASNLMARQPTERQKHIYGQLWEVTGLVERQREATSAHDVVSIRLAEADILASLLALKSKPYAPDGAAREAFNEWVKTWSRVGYLVDSLVDTKRDYENGESKVKASLGSRAIYGAAAAKESVAALKRTPLRALAKCAINGVNYIVRQRRPEVTEITSSGSSY